MTMTKTLAAEKREGTGKGVARKLRQSGRVPAVVYGKDMDAVSLSVDANEALHLFETISVENTVVDLQVDGESHTTLVREIQSHPVRRELIHIDFLRIQAGVMVELEIPVHLEGTPIGVKMNGGVLDHIVHELPVRCIPSNIPDSINVDVSGLDLNDSIHVSDLVLGDDIEVLMEPEQTICAISVPRTPTLDAEEEEAEAEAEAAAAAEAEAGADDEGDED